MNFKTSFLLLYNSTHYKISLKTSDAVNPAEVEIGGLSVAFPIKFRLPKENNSVIYSENTFLTNKSI